MQLEFCQRIFIKTLKYQISWKSLYWEPNCSTRADGQTDMTKLIVALRSFAKGAWKRSFIRGISFILNGTYCISFNSLRMR